VNKENMKKTIGLILIFICMNVFGCTNNAAIHVKTPDNFHKHLESVTVALLELNTDPDNIPEGNFDKYNFRLYCSGVWISENVILTDHHCVEKEDGSDEIGNRVFYSVANEIHEQGEFPSSIHTGYVKAVDNDHDLALIATNEGGRPSHQIAEIANELPAIGEHIFVLGHPKGFFYTHMEGVVSGYRISQEIGPVIQINCSAYFGNSGGGAYNDNGQLIGVASRLTPIPQVSYFASAQSIKNFLNK
jgi:S1-C subfamily serine protease